MVLLSSVTALEGQQDFVKQNPLGAFRALGRRSQSSWQCWNEVGWMEGVTLRVTSPWSNLWCLRVLLCFQVPVEWKVSGSRCRGPFRTHGVGWEPNDLFGLAAVASGCSCPGA